MALIQLNHKAYPVVAMLYKQQALIFPLIQAVLNLTQPGVVMWDGYTNNYFIIHHFGFCDLISADPTHDFDQALLCYIQQKDFLVEKLRWYNTPSKWQKWLIGNDNIAIVERMQLSHPAEAEIYHYHLVNSVDIRAIDASNIEIINRTLSVNIDTRFWPSAARFLQRGFGVCAYQNGTPIAVCYTCALEDNRVEVDILTDTSKRNTGIGKCLLSEFIQLCRSKKLSINWDCYSNNLPSVRLAELFKFELVNTYAHAIITK